MAKRNDHGNGATRELLGELIARIDYLLTRINGRQPGEPVGTTSVHQQILVLHELHADLGRLIAKLERHRARRHF